MTKFHEHHKTNDEPQTQVKEASCYGNLASCETPGQKCCRTTYERVCQQVGDNDVDVDAKFSVPKRALINITFTNKHTKGGQLQSPSKPSTIITKKILLSNQVPTRVPVMVNMTIPGRPIRKQDCQMVERTIPRYDSTKKWIFLGLFPK